MTTDSIERAVREYYASFGRREWSRLEQGEGAVEFAVTTYALAKHLPASGRILDIGGGPGRYAIWLAERGYRVVLADLVPDMLEIARTKVREMNASENVEAIVEANATDLRMWPDNAFDAVLSLGAFYHLPHPKEREAAAAEMVRVLRPGGFAFVAFMPRYAFLRRTISNADERHRISDQAWLTRLLSDGFFENDVPGRFNGGHGACPSEIGPFFDAFGFEQISLLSAESLSLGLHDVLVELAESEPETHKGVIDLMVGVADDPSIHGMSSHLLYVGELQNHPFNSV